MNDLKLVGFTTINGNPVFINPGYVIAVHAFGMTDSEILLAHGSTSAKVKLDPESVAVALVHGRPPEREPAPDNSWLDNNEGTYHAVC